MFNSNIRSIEELISMALASERDVIRQYSGIATRMKGSDNPVVGALFEEMLVEERAYEQKLVQWAELEGLAIDSDIRPVSWEHPAVATIYDADATDPGRSTTYKALAFAVHIKERGFRFYSYIAAGSADPDVRRYAEVLAHEELARAARLRIQRRVAWREHRKQREIEPEIDPATIQGLADLFAATACIERFIFALMEVAVPETPNPGALLRGTGESLSSSEAALRDSDSPNPELSASLQSVSLAQERRLAEIEDAADALRRLSGACDRSFTFYDSVVTSSRDEATMLQAQHYSELALERIAELSHISEAQP